MLPLILSFATTTLLMVSAEPRTERIDESTAKIKELQKDRIATLRELVAISTKLYQSGRASYDEALDAQVLLLKAELDAAEKASDRVAIYREFIELMKGYEKLAAAQKQAARGTDAAILKFKAKRLEAEIQLEKTKAKAAKQNR
jgi:hypothetical protein